jgi:hypothetical protein
MRVAVLGFLLCVPVTLAAQSGVGVEVDEVIDNRMAHEMLVGSLQLRVKLTGTNLDKATAARVIVKEAKDDRGTVLVKAGEDPPDFMGREYNNGMVAMSLGAPARAASTVKVKGTVELFVPSRDPNAVIKIEKALAKLDKPLVHKNLKAAKVDITPLSAAAYAAKKKQRKITEDDIAKIRAEGKSRGVSEKEIELMIGLAKAFEEDETPLQEGTIILSGGKSAFERLYLIELLGPDGKPIDLPQKSSSTRGDDTLMTLVPSAPPPANSALKLTMLTDKSTMSFPFEMTIELP